MNQKAAQLLIESQNPTIAFLQRQLKLGYGAAQALMSRLEEAGIVTPPDESGYRRLTPRYEKVSTQVFNEWRVFPQTEEAPLEGVHIDVSAAVAAVRPFSPIHVSFFRESGLPFVELVFSRILTPSTVIALGLELQHVLARPVYLTNLQPRTVEFVVEGDFLLPEGEQYSTDPFQTMRVPLSELAGAWGVDQ